MGVVAFELKDVEILGQTVSLDSIRGMTTFPSFYEPFLRLDNTAEKHKRFKCLGERLPIPDGPYIVTEKIDGENCGLFGWLDKAGNSHLVVRSREELIGYSYDLLCNDKDGMITTLRPHVQSVQEQMSAAYPDALWMLYMEFYGPGVKKPNYGPKKNVRVFAARLYREPQLKLFAETQREKYDALRRVNRHAPFLPWDDVKDIAGKCGLQTVPYFGVIDGEQLETPEDVMELLNGYSPSQTAKDDGGDTRSEGFVTWSAEGKDYRHPKAGDVMAAFKLKFEDYPQS